MMTGNEDRWAEWFLHPGLESGGDRYAATLRTLVPIRDRVIAAAGVKEGSVVVDIGSGSGLVAFALADRVGAEGRVYFIDISREMLDHCRGAAVERGLHDRCIFIQTSALDLGAIPDGSVDAVTVRSVLIYIEQRADALREIHRILKPGGRLSIYEPAIRHHATGEGDASSGITVCSIEEMLAPLLERAPHEEGSVPELDERELLACAEGCGFSSINLSLEIDVARGVYFTGSASDGDSDAEQSPAAHEVMHRTAGIYLRAVK